jgi:hypothetical protein
MKIFVWMMVIAAAGQAAEVSLPGAKQIFGMDPTSGAQIKDGPKKGTRPSNQPAAELKSAVKGATGLQYWIELQTPGGPARVPSNYVFHTGDRIRLHITSNVDGKLVVMQSQDQGPYQLLFPAGPQGDNRVRKYQDNVFPPKFFRFDNNPGDVRLMLMVTADGAAQLPVAAAPSEPEPPSAPVRPARPTAPSPAATANPQRASASGGNPDLRAQYEAELRTQAEKLRGSKALIVEDDTTGPDPSTTVVVLPVRDSKVSPGVVVVEVRLTHRS